MEELKFTSIELATLLKIEIGLIERCVADGAPKGEDTKISLIELAAWLCRERLKSED